MKSNNENIIFYRSWWDSLVSKSPDFRHSVMDAVFAYAFEEKSPTFPKESGQQIAFENIVSYIDQNREKFAKSVARWEERKRSLASTGNATARSVPAGSVNKDKDKDKEKDNVKDKDKDNGSKEIDTLSLSHKNKNISSAEGDGERERVVFEYALFLLAEGRISAYENAFLAWEYNEALDWKREVVRRNGDRVQQPIGYKLSWLKNREQKPPQEFESEHGAVLAAILRRSGILPENASIIDDFRGFGLREQCVYFLYAHITKAVRSFSVAIRENPKINNIVSQELTRAFPGSESFAVIAKKDF